MKNSFSLLLVVLFMSLSFLYNAQVFPVSTTIVMPYPHPIFLTDYYEVGGTDLQATINLVDFNVPNHDVRLRVSIENEYLKIFTSPNFKPAQPLSLTPGIPLTLQGSDFTDYLHINNIETEGISIAQLNQQSGRLPEGQYNFCIQVIDYNSNKVLSQEMCFTAYLFLEQPPVTLEPECESFVNPSNPQNVNFGWQIAGGASPIVSAMSTFKLFLYEITDPAMADPKYAVENSKAILVYESAESSLNTFNLNLNTILLQAGKQYVYRIKAIGPNGKEIFSNEGFSEWCWFFYGFPADGVLEITEPFDGEIFSKTQQKTFVWGVSNKGVSGQNYSYNIKIVKKDTNQTAEAAMSNNSVYYEERLPQTSSQDGASFLLNQNLDPDTEYAYIIEAFSEGQQVASSEVKTFFSHSLIENFYASNQLIEVTQVYGNNINDLSGKARIAMSDDPSDFVDIEFSHLDLKEVAGLMVLEDGIIEFDLSDRDELLLSPEIASNGNAYFVYNSGIITKDGLLMKGVINWTIPHAVLSDQSSDIVSIESDFVVNSQGQMTGVASLVPFSTILLSPNQFKLELDGTSQLSINENIFQINVKGYITLPETVVNQAGDPIRIEIERHVQQIDYIELDNLIGKLNGGLGLFENLNIEVLPTTGCVFDFSESISPTKLSADPDWKGVYFTDYKVRFKSQNFDGSNQLKLASNRDYDFSTEGTSSKFWIDNNGVTFKTDIAVSVDKDLVTFNTFPSPLNFEIDINKNAIEKAEFLGAIKFPFLDEDNDFGYKINATESGLEQGYLLDSIAGLKKVYNPFGGENRMDIEINRGVFLENQYLSLNVDIDIPELDASIESIEDFRIYGDSYVGIGGKNKSKSLDSPVPATYKAIEMTVLKVGAAFLGDKYALSYTAEANLGSSIAGDDGPPILSISSVRTTEASSSSTASIVTPEIEVPQDEGQDAQKLTLSKIAVSIESPVIDATGYIGFSDNDPYWGTKFEGGVDVNVKLPVQLNMGANLVLGMKGSMDYWYVDAYYEDVSGVGVQVQVPVVQVPLFNIVGLEGKIYRHMKSEVDDEGNFSIDLDENIQFGAALYGQIIDPVANGFFFQADLAAELSIIGQGLTVESINLSIAADAAFLNANVRVPGSGGAVSGVAGVVAEEVVTAVMDEFLPQTFTIADNEVTVSASSFKEGQIDIGDYAAGSGFKFGGNVNDKPSIELGLAQDGFSIGGSADATGSGSFDMSIGTDFSVNSVMSNMNSGVFNFTIGSTISASVEAAIETKYGKLDIDLDGTTLFVEADATNNKGAFSTSFDDYKFNASADLNNTAGTLGFEIGSDTKLDIAANGSNQTGVLTGEISGVEFSSSIDLNEKTGNFGLETSTATISAEASSTNGTFYVEKGSTVFDLHTDVENKIGHMDLTYPNNQMKGDLALDSASIFIKKNALEIGVGAQFDGSMGRLHLKDEGFLLDVLANANNELGRLDFEFEEASISSLYNPSDSSFIKFKDGQDIKEASITATGTQFLHVKEGASDYSLYLNPTDVIGRFNIEEDEFKFNGLYNETSETARVNLKISSDSVSANIAPGLAMLAYSVGNNSFFGSYDEQGTQILRFADKSADTEQEITYNEAQEAASVFVKDGNDTIHLAGNKSANTALINVNLDNIDFKGAINDSIMLQSGTFSLLGKQDGTGRLSYTDNSDKVELFKSDEKGLISFVNGGVEFDLGVNFTETTTNINYKNNGDQFDFSYGEAAASLNLISSDISMSLDGDKTTGDGNINFQSPNFVLQSVVEEDQNTITFNKGDVSIVGTKTIGENNTSATLTKGNDVYAFEYAPSKQTVSYSSGSALSLTAEKEAAAYTLVFEKDAKKITTTKDNETKQLKYEGDGVVAIVGNNLISSEYENHEVKLLDKKVFVDGNEIYDYSSVNTSVNIDYSNFYFPSLDISTVDFTGTNLSGADVNGVDFTGVNFQGVNLTGVDLTGVDFAGVDLTGVDFTGVGLSTLDISGVNFTGFNFNNVNLGSTNFTGFDFTGVDLNGVDFTGFNFNNLNLSNVNFTGFNFTGVDLSGVDFTGVNFQGADFSNITFSPLSGGSSSSNNGNGTNSTGQANNSTGQANNSTTTGTLTAADLNGQDLSGQDFTGAIFGSTDLSGINFTGINFGNIDLSGINFTGVDFGSADLSGVDLSGVDLSGVNSNGSNLTGADLTGVDLSGVDFTGFNFSNMNLSSVNFSGFNFTGISLSGINFTGVNFQGADFSNVNFNSLSGGNNSGSSSNGSLTNNTGQASNSSTGGTLTASDLNGQDLSGQDFTGASFGSTDLSGVNFTGVDFGNLDLSSVNFSGVDFGSVDLSGINFTGANFGSLDLSSINFSGVDFGTADLSGINFTGVDFGTVNIADVDFTGVNFGTIDISNVDFSGVDFGTTDLSGVDFTGVDFTGTDLSSLNFSDVSLPSLPDVDWEHTEVINDVTIKIKLSGQEYDFTVLKGSDSIHVFTNNWIDNAIDLYANSDFVHVSKINEKYEVVYNDYKASLENEELAVEKGADYSLSISPEKVAVKYETYSVEATDENTITFTDGSLESKITTEYLSVSKAGKELKIGRDKSFYAKHSDDKNITISTEGATLNYDNKNFSLDNNAIAYTEGANEYTVSTNELKLKRGAKEVEITSERLKLTVEADKTLEYVLADENLILNYSDKSFSVSRDKEVTFNDPQRSVAVSPDNLSYTQDGKSINVTPNSLSLDMGAGNLASVINDQLSLSYDQHVLEVEAKNNPHFNYSHGTSVLEISPTRVNIGSNGKGISASSDSISVVFDDNYARFSGANMSFKYDRYEAEFVNWTSISATNGTQNFEVDESTMVLAIDADNYVKVLLDDNDKPYLNLKKGDEEFVIGTDKAEFDFEDKHYLIGGGETYLKVSDKGETDPTEGLIIKEEGLIYNMGETQLIMGGQDHFLSLTNEDKSATVSYDMELGFTYGSYAARIDQNLKASLYIDDSSHIININDNEKALTYSYPSSNASLSLLTFDDNSMGLQMDYDNYSGFVKGVQNEYIIAGGNIPSIGEVSFKVDKDSKVDLSIKEPSATVPQISVTFADNELERFQFGDLVYPLGGAGAIDSIEGIDNVEMNGPAHLSDVTDNAMGWGYAGIQAQLNIDLQNPTDTKLISNGTITTGISLPILCATAPFGFEVSKDKVLFKLASASNRATLNPFCLDGFPEFSGYTELEVLNSTSSSTINVELGLGLELDLGGSISISTTACDVSLTAACAVALNLDAAASITIPTSPEGSADFTLSNASVDLDASASLIGEICGVASSVSANVKGKLAVSYVGSEMKVAGDCTGSVSVGGITKSFTTEFKQTF